MNILLVEDDPDILETLAKGLALSFPTFRIATAGSAEDAELEIARGFVPKLVIIDIRLPGKSGVELLLELHDELPETRFILTSAYSPPVLRFRAKPFELSRLVAEVQGAYMSDQFSGSYRAITFIDILQVLNMARRTALVQLHRGEQAIGEIYLVVGQVHHAVSGTLEGAEAFRALCAEPTVAFRVRSEVRPPRRTIDEPFDLLLIDVMGDEED